MGFSGSSGGEETAGHVWCQSVGTSLVIPVNVCLSCYVAYINNINTMNG